jgi:hypothetical protein
LDLQFKLGLLDLITQFKIADAIVNVVVRDSLTSLSEQYITISEKFAGEFFLLFLLVIKPGIEAPRPDERTGCA